LLHAVVISVDSQAELDMILAQHELLRHAGAPVEPRARVLLRLCGFSASHSHYVSRESRFGIRIADAEPVLQKIASVRGELELLGFAFHLDTTSIDERVVALENCIQLFERCLELGLEPSVLNIGGGFRINYLQAESDWHRYTSALREAALGSGPQFTWHHDYFGLSAQSGKLRGEINSYPYFEAKPGAAFLRELLASELPAYNGQSVASVLRENMIELWLEPGRALLDQAGVTLASVTSDKVSSAGNQIVLVDMRRQDLAFYDREVFVDPVLLSDREGVDANGEMVYVAGSLCLESDLIFRRKVFLAKKPAAGDILAFVNSAAYMMDFSATTTGLRPQAAKVAVVQGDSGFVWTLDDRYTPALQATLRRV
jgi:diaminopimelate decarboxylase